jgi:hypothetical protein
MESVAAPDRLLEKSPGTSVAVVRAIAKTHAALKKNVSLAAGIGRELFPLAEAELIKRDLLY